jgi:hypothetical protein
MVSSPSGDKRPTTWRTAALGILGSAALAVGPTALFAETYAQQHKSQRVVLVELYTSQGCSSCPPADQLQSELAERPDVLALTFPVDYWDYLGWRDTLAHPANTHRQIEYSKRSQSGRVFTPQMVIDGMISAVGGDRVDVLRKIAEREMTASLVPLTIEVKDDSVSVEVPAAPGALSSSDSGKATLWLFPFDKMNVVHIGGGENAGRSGRYSHVVGNVAALGQWSGTGAKFEHTFDQTDRGRYGYAAVLQEDRVGPVIGVAWAGDVDRIQGTPMAPDPGALADPLVVNMPR